MTWLKDSYTNATAQCMLEAGAHKSLGSSDLTFHKFTSDVFVYPNGFQTHACQATGSQSRKKGPGTEEQTL